jgi:hypothetical protein
LIRYPVSHYPLAVSLYRTVALQSLLVGSPNEPAGLRFLPRALPHP